MATCCVYVGGCSWDCTAGTAPKIPPMWGKPVSPEAHHSCVCVPTVTVDGFSISFQLPNSAGIHWKNQCCIRCLTDTLWGFTSPKQTAPKNSHRTAQCSPDQQCLTGTTSSSHCQAAESQKSFPNLASLSPHWSQRKTPCFASPNGRDSCRSLTERHREKEKELLVSMQQLCPFAFYFLHGKRERH